MGKCRAVRYAGGCFSLIAFVLLSGHGLELGIAGVLREFVGGAWAKGGMEVVPDILRLIAKLMQMALSCLEHAFNLLHS